MFRKMGLLVIVAFLCISILVACNQKPIDEDGKIDTVKVGKLHDGKYLVKLPVIEQGSYSMAQMEVAKGDIISFEYREIFADNGEEKSEDNYNYQDCLDVIEDLNRQFNEKKNLAHLNFDAVSGATFTKEEFKRSVKELLKKASKGESYEPAYRDGVYEAQAEEADNGWLSQVRVIIKEGQIVGIDYSELAIKDMERNKVVFDQDKKPIRSTDGKPKTETVEVRKGDKKSVDNYAHLDAFDVIKGVQKQLIDNNGVEDLNLDGITGATKTMNIIIELVARALEDAV